jgi:polysaccharide export outer membrane protein
MRIAYATISMAASAILGGCASTTNVRAGIVPDQVLLGAATADPFPDYLIGPLDMLSVSVFKEPDVTLPQVQVDGAGRFEMPLIGTVNASGKTAAELSREIAHGLGERYLINPKVAVNVAAMNSQKVTIEGAVVAPGVFLLQGETTLEGMIALAKGPTRVAKLDQVAIFRKTGGRRTVAVFDLKAIREGRAADPAMVAGDVVVVGFSGLAQVFQDALRAIPALAVFSTF